MSFSPFFTTVSKSFDDIFVVDKRGNTVFFPWGTKKQGYLIKDIRIIPKVKSFYYLSFLISLAIPLAMAPRLNNFWMSAGVICVCLGGWFFAYYLYTVKITKPLRIFRKSYKEIVLEKLEPDELEDSN